MHMCPFPFQLVDQFSEDKYVMANLGQSLLKERTRDRALVHDPVLNGHKELLKIYILKPTFRAFEEHRRQRYVEGLGFMHAIN